MKLYKILSAVGMSMASAIGTAYAAPTMSPTNLPVDDQLVQGLTAQGKTQDQIKAFLTTLSHIQVYDDHKNPPNAQRGDRTKSKIFWAAPYLTASPTRSIVGAEQFADSSLTILDDADDLLASFNLLAKEFTRLNDQLKDVNKKIGQIDAALLANPDPIKRASLEALRVTLVAERDRLTQQKADLEATGSDGAAQLGLALRHDIANAFVLQMSRLSVVATADERTKLASDDASTMVFGIASMRSRANDGQFGLRQVILEAGFNTQQRDALTTYLALRPDVSTRGLAVQNVVAHPTAQTLIGQDGTYTTRTSVMLYRGINLGSAGACGGTQSCNVVIEYTASGARDARFLGLSTERKAVLVPVTFESNVRVAEPDFVGSVHCHFVTGWTAEGRADIKDGAIIYSGDLANKIKYDLIDDPNGGCQMNIQEGDSDSAFFHALQDIDESYRRIYAERQQASKNEKDAYRAQIEAELAWQQQHSQQRRTGGWFSDVLGFVTHGSFVTGIASFLIAETRGFYWHTTTLDTHNIDPLDINQTYVIRNTTAVRKYAFDGFPLVCYTPQPDGSRPMKACPDADFPNGDTETQTGDGTCPETDIFGNCADNQD